MPRLGGVFFSQCELGKCFRPCLGLFKSRQSTFNCYAKQFGRAGIVLEFLSLHQHGNDLFAVQNFAGQGIDPILARHMGRSGEDLLPEDATEIDQDTLDAIEGAYF